MYTVSLLGAEAERAAERLVAAVDGRAGIVRVGGTDGGRRLARAATEYTVGEGWRATGTGLSVRDAVDRLAPDHGYAFLLGAPDAPFPRIVVGNGEGGDALLAADGADDLDPSAAVDAIHGTEPHETLESLVAAVKRSDRADYAGSIATFTGRVRAKEHDADDRTQLLEFEKYDGVADRRMATIESELEARDGVLDVRLHHRTGKVPDGEDIVYVVVLAGHREEAFRAVKDGIDRLKDEVPLFKKEVTEAETFWVHEREET